MEPLAWHVFHGFYLLPLWGFLVLALTICEVGILSQYHSDKHNKKVKPWWSWLMLGYCLFAIANFLLYANSWLLWKKIGKPMLIFAFIFSLFLLISRFFYFKKFSWIDLLSLVVLLISVYFCWYLWGLIMWSEFIIRKFS